MIDIKNNEFSSKNYLFEKNRLETFVNWPFDDDAMCSKKKMSEAGFVWRGNENENDISSCFLCQKTLDGWEETDNPWEEHRNHAPQCAFVKLGKKEDDMTVEEIFDIYKCCVVKNLERNVNEIKLKLKKSCESHKSKIMEVLKK